MRSPLDRLPRHSPTGNRFTRNSITANRGKGIRSTQSANQGISPPWITNVTERLVMGTARAPNRSRMEIFQDSQDEGMSFLTAAAVGAGHFLADWDPAMWRTFGLTATVTDPDGNTSEFGSMAHPAVFLAGLLYCFRSDRDGDWEVYCAGHVERVPRRITTDPAQDTHSVLPPDGQQVWFVSNRTGHGPFPESIVRTPGAGSGSWMLSEASRLELEIGFGTVFQRHSPVEVLENCRRISRDLESPSAGQRGF